MSFAIASPMSRRHRIAAAVLIAALIGAAAPAFGDDRVYVWRDPSGAIHFSAVDEQREPAVAAAPVETRSDPDPRLAANDTRE